MSSYGCSCGRKLGEVTSINITMLEAGVKTTVDEETGIQNYAFNVIPEVARAGFDTRVRIHSSYHVKNDQKSNTPQNTGTPECSSSEVQGSSRHHRDFGNGRVVRRRQTSGGSCSKDREVPESALLRC